MIRVTELIFHGIFVLIDLSFIDFDSEWSGTGETFVFIQQTGGQFNNT